MKVYTYFRQDPKLANFDSLLALWEDKWKEAGFDPVVLRDEPKEHPLFKQVLAHVEGLPTVNPRVYTTNDFIRWLAMEQVGGGLHVDSDVFPRGKMPCFPCLRGIYTFGIGHCPCAVWLPKLNATQHCISKRILSYGLQQADKIRGRAHCSDQGFFQWWKPGYSLMCPNCTDPKSATSPMVHYPTDDVDCLPGGTKGDKVRFALTKGLPLVK
jgi:hypothetical protein